MIVLLTLAYVLILLVLVHMKKVPNNIFTWSTVIIWMALLIFVLFFPMKIGAPSGEARFITYSVSIVPNVSGPVTEIVAEPNKPLKKGDVLFKIDDRPYRYALDAQLAQLENAKQGVAQLKVSLKAAKATVKQAAIARDQAKQVYNRYAAANKKKVRPFTAEQVETARLNYEGAEAALEKAVAGEESAKLSLQAEVNGVNTNVAILTAQVENARYNLEQTIVRAPSDGEVTILALRVGQRVSPATSAMTFLENSANFVSVQIDQIYHRHIRLGQKTEVQFKTRPGEIYTGKVAALIETTALGEIAPAGGVPKAPELTALPLFVRIELDDTEAVKDIPAGSVGEAAIYTDALKPVQVIQRVTIRMDAFMNYIKP